jgi:hypothetical protein
MVFDRSKWHRFRARHDQGALNASHIHITWQNVKNITLSIDDNTYRAAKITAVDRGQSVSALVRDLLQNLSGHGRSTAEEIEALFEAMNRAKSRG